MEREVVLSCLGKEYLERITMQNYLQDICSKSGYNYDQILSNIVTQSGGNNILESLMKTRAKELLTSKDKPNEQLAKPQLSHGNKSVNEKNWNNVSTENDLKEKDTVNSIQIVNKRHLKDLLKKFTEAEMEKVSDSMKRSHNKMESSHTPTTKEEGTLKEISLGESLQSKNITGDSCNGDRSENNAGFVELGQSFNGSSKHSRESYNIDAYSIDKSCKGQNNEANIERPVLRATLKGDSMALQLRDKQVKSIMPEKIESTMNPDGNASILIGLDVKRLDAPEKSLDSIDEGIFMIKSFLQELQKRSQVLVTNDLEGDDKPPKARRKISLNETEFRGNSTSDPEPQRRRSFAEGVNMNRGKVQDSKSAVESRLFKPTVASKNKAKDRVSRRDFDSDTESGRKTKERPRTSLSRSVSDVRHGPKRFVYNSYTSAEDDSSVDGEDRNNPDVNSTFRYVYQTNSGVSDREYGKLLSILNMLHEQKLKWDNEAKSLQGKLDEERKLRADLGRDNGVLRKSLEAANHAIKEINSKVQELKLTIVPLRDENSKLRDQNQSLKAKLDLLRKDKALLLQEAQELKQTKQRYEDKLRILAGLYHEKRLKLIADGNNNTEGGAVELPKGGLGSLVDFGADVDDKDRLVAPNKRLGRNRDNPKRHSFHGFEKIDELAGNAEELLAEKEKLEQENDQLKEQLKTIQEKAKSQGKRDSEKEADMMNRRRGWRMQREESKHRIIREILKTESNQVYGRPYASCTNLSLDDDMSDIVENQASVYGAKQFGTEDEADAGLNLGERIDEKRGGMSFEIGIERKEKPRAALSWKEESEKIQKRLQSCKFDRPIVMQKFAAAKESRFNAEEPKKSIVREQQTNGMLGFQRQAKAIYDLGAFYYKKGDFLQDSQEGSKVLKNGSVGMVTNSNEGTMKQQGGEQKNDGKRSEVKQSLTTSLSDSWHKESDSLASPQWPLIREKIQNIYKQPVEILEQSLYNKTAQSEKYQNWQGAKFDTKDEVTAEWAKQKNKEKRVQSGGALENDRFEFGRDGSLGGDRTDGSNNATVAPTMFNTKTPNAQDREEMYGRSEDNWQRKSASEEITSYEDYRRRLKREELQNASQQLNANGTSRQRDNDQIEQSKRASLSGKSSRNSEELDEPRSEYKISNEMKASRKEMATREVNKRVNGYHPSNENRKGIQEKDSLTLRDNSPWVQVPVYAESTTEPRKEESAVPQARWQKINESRSYGFETKNSVKEERLFEETIQNVESAFVNVRASSENGKTRKESKSRGREFVRQSPGTVMYLDEIADSDSGSSSETPKTIPRRRSKSLRRSRPKSDIFTGTANGIDVSGRNSYNSEFRRNRSLRLPKKSKDDMFSVDINFEGESRDDSVIQMHSQSFTSSQKSSTKERRVQCQHQQMHQAYDKQQAADSGRRRMYSETGTDMTGSSLRRSKSPGGFSCEMCRELSRNKIAQERYCWEKYFPIGETTIETRVIKEDYV